MANQLPSADILHSAHEILKTKSTSEINRAIERRMDYELFENSKQFQQSRDKVFHFLENISGFKQLTIPQQTLVITAAIRNKIYNGTPSSIMPAGDGKHFVDNQHIIDERKAA